MVGISKGIILSGIKATQIEEYVEPVLLPPTISYPKPGAFANWNILFMRINPVDIWPRPKNLTITKKKQVIEILNANKEIVHQIIQTDNYEINVRFDAAILNLETLLEHKINWEDQLVNVPTHDYKKVEPLKGSCPFNGGWAGLDTNSVVYSSTNLENWTNHGNIPKFLNSNNTTQKLFTTYDTLIYFCTDSNKAYKKALAVCPVDDIFKNVKHTILDIPEDPLWNPTGELMLKFENIWVLLITSAPKYSITELTTVNYIYSENNGIDWNIPKNSTEQRCEQLEEYLNFSFDMLTISKINPNQIVLAKTNAFSPIETEYICSLSWDFTNKQLVGTKSTIATIQVFNGKNVTFQLLPHPITEYQNEFYIFAKNQNYTDLTLYYSKLNKNINIWEPFVAIVNPEANSGYSTISTEILSSGEFQLVLNDSTRIPKFTTTDFINWKFVEYVGKNLVFDLVRTSTTVSARIFKIPNTEPPVGYHSPDILIREKPAMASEQLYLKVTCTSTQGEHLPSELVPFRLIKQIPVISDYFTPTN